MAKTLTIDGKEVTARDDATIIQAAHEAGMTIPHYCYHPKLSIAGNCRMCLIELEGRPKLEISCNTPVADDMVVYTNSPRVVEGRRGVLEFLLINHPLDCPICDQAGECGLQDYYMQYGLYTSRFQEEKVHKHKVVDFGPDIVFDGERCILCTRCVRFTQEISQSHELGLFNRGDTVEISTFPGTQLDNKYAGNTVDICPVGALTEREFRFQCRVWYLSTRESICNGCSRGCNISIHYNTSRSYKAGGKRVQRLKPRLNPHVNRWWMCDEGRFGYEFIDHNRIEFPHLRLAQGELQTSDWKQALQEVSTGLKTTLEQFGPEGIGVIASGQLSNEELYLIRKIFAESMGVQEIGYRNPWEEEGFQDDLLIRGDKNPNSRGAEELGLKSDVRKILEKAASGVIKILYIFQHNFESPEAQKMLGQAEYVIFQGTNWNKTVEYSNAVLPGSTHAEKDGTFTNFEGRLRQFQQALLPLSESKADIEILRTLAQKLEVPLAYLDAEEIFKEWSGRTFQELEEFGELVNGKKR